MSPFLLLAIFGVASAQLHAPEVKCYDCHGGHPDFQDCLNHEHMCHGDEICQVKYGEHTEVKCRKAHDCQHELDHAHQTCSTGGAMVHNSCQLCCADDACLADAISALQNATQVADALHCPHDCPLDNLADCLTRGELCVGDKFCKVTVDTENGILHGKCEHGPTDHCEEELAKGHCDPHGCLSGCCTDDACVAGTLGVTTASSAPDVDTTILAMAATSAPPVDNTTPDAIANSGHSTTLDVSSIACGDLNGMGCGVLDAICPLVDCTAQCAPCLAPIEVVSSTSAPVTEPASTTEPTGAPGLVCQDTLQGMTCDSVRDVCSSPLLSAYCQKSCGVCH